MCAKQLSLPTVTTSWVMKKKANSTFRERVNAIGFMQIDVKYYNSDNIFLPCVVCVIYM